MTEQDDDITFYRNLPPLPFVPARDTEDLDTSLCLELVEGGTLTLVESGECLEILA